MDHTEQTRVPAKLLKHPAHLLSLGFGSGLSPKMPGTVGTLVGVIAYLGLAGLDWRLYLAVLILLFIAGVAVCGFTARALGVHDHPAIVVDEIVGYLVTMFLVPVTPVFIVTGFLLFRLFDILKPWPISLVDKSVKGGVGIMLDDLIAALFSLLIIQIIVYLL